MKTYVVYHAHCVDGLAAAAIASWKLVDNNPELIAQNYNQSLPVFEEGSEIYLVDFCLTNEEIQAIAPKMRKIIICDHHERVSEINPVPANVTIVFDKNKCGAMLTWQYFSPNFEPPEVLNYIQDRDLWLKKLPCCDEIAAALATYLDKPNPIDSFFTIMRDGNISKLIDFGTILLEQKYREIKRLLKNAFITNVAGSMVPTINSPVHQSELGHRLCELFPDAPYAAIYSDVSQTERVWSLRSNKGLATKAAKSMGGGGHPSGNAAGFKETFTPGSILVIKERQRQIHEEGFTSEHDDQYTQLQLQKAALAYLWDASRWPFSKESFKMKDTISDLKRSAALMIAEIDRLLRRKHGH